MFIEMGGMIDSHVHTRGFKESLKGDFGTETKAALAGGVVVILDMPNNNPPIITSEMLRQKKDFAGRNAFCDWGVYYGAAPDNAGKYGETPGQVVGLKMFLNQTHGPLLLDNEQAIVAHLRAWPKGKPIMVHAEDETVLKLLKTLERLRAEGICRPVHFAHISQKEEIGWIREAKENNLPVTCEVTPHHLFLTEDDEKQLGAFGKMKPPLRTQADVEALWRAINLGIVDTIGSDHAPHTKEEKMSGNPPFGVPGLETTLPLLLTAYVQGRLSLEKINQLTWENPERIFGLEPLRRGVVKVEVDFMGKSNWTISDHDLLTKCGWSPFDGMEIRAKVRRVFLGGKRVFEDGQVFSLPGSGREVVLYQA